MSPTETLDRIAALCDDADHESGGDFRGWLPADVVRGVLAEVTPETGVTLTPEEAARAAGWYYGQAAEIIVDDADRALAARLEAARVTPREALARIAALCDDDAANMRPETKGILADVTPETGEPLLHSYTLSDRTRLRALHATAVALGAELQPFKEEDEEGDA